MGGLIMIKHLSDKQKAEILDAYIHEINSLEYGTIRGTTQILEGFDNIAIEKGFVVCPLCKRGLKHA
jgi:hypothetical protein